MIKAQFLFNTFTTAIEGGIGYWAECTDYHWCKANGQEDLSGTYAYITTENVDGEYVNTRIDIQTITNGFLRLLEGPVLGLAESYRALLIGAWFTYDAGDIIDAAGADIVIQVGIFNEVVYG